MNGRSSRMPPENRNARLEGSPMTRARRARARMMSSIPERTAVPGATRLSAEMSFLSFRGSALIESHPDRLPSVAAVLSDLPCGFVPSGTTTSDSPSFAHSASRRSACETGRSRPVRPISPKHANLRDGLPRAAEAIASATPRSAPGSSIRTPPATFTNTSAWPRETPACRPSTATIIERRFGSTPVPTRRGMARSVGETSAWISSRIGRVPSSAHATADPAVSLRPSEELGGIGDPDEAGGRHLEDSELVRRAEAVLDRAKHAVRAVAVAFELEHAVDEVLEDARAGDGAILRHVPDQEDGDAFLLRQPEQATGGFPHLATDPGAEPSSGA